jgi:hypothetical protein
MRKHKRRLLAMLAVGLVMLALWGIGSALHQEGPPAAIRNKIERVQFGMPREEVEAILGRPPDTHVLSTLPNESEVMSDDSWAMGEDGTFMVLFDGSGRVKFMCMSWNEKGFLGRVAEIWRRWCPGN